MLVTKRLTLFISLAALFVLSAASQPHTTDTVYINSGITARIDFKVNHTEWDKAYHGNDTILDKALAAIDSLVLDRRMEVRRITIVGTASPEGPLKGNIQLATNRAKTLLDILKHRYSFPDSIYAISTIPEDWDGMRLMVSEDSSIPYAEVVVKFIDRSSHIAPDTRESQLKDLDGGRPYASMLDNVLPFLRRASVVIDYNRTTLHLTDLHSPVMPYNTFGKKIPASDFRVELPDMTANATTARRQRFFSVKTNLLWDAALCANLGFEVELWPHWSLDVPVWYSPYDITDRWRIRLLATQPEVRYWPKDAGAGHYFGVHASVVGFNVSTNGKYRYQDPNHAAFGLGVGYGYAFHLDKEHRWGLEAQIGVGYISYKWIKYHNTGRNGAEVSRSAGTYWGLTRAGVTIAYKFYKERKERRWMKW